jgi:arylsulfatase A-like enzyme
MKRFEYLLLIGLLPLCLQAAPTESKPVNLLIIMTDQQRWDALGCAGNTVIKTPNLDSLAGQGARFTSFYSACPVCVPARTAILTGHDIEANHVLGNDDVRLVDYPTFLSFDQILLRAGYQGEYHGKYHSPYKLAMDYTQPVRWLNGKQRPPGCKADMSDAAAFAAFLAAHEPKRELKPGELVGRVGIYKPIPLDANFGKAVTGKVGEGEAYGQLQTSPEHSITAYTAREGLEALGRLKRSGGPFTLTISLDPPHPPQVVSEPYYSMYPPANIPVPVSINDPMTNSPYHVQRAAYREPKNIQQMTSVYYGMVTEVDDWVGKILKRLDELELAKNTLVIFASDHGEMLGDHGMHSKMVFYEGSAHVPLLMRLPGVIPANTVIRAPASHLDLFPTILDYCGQPAHPSVGSSLRPLVEGKDGGTGRVAISEWNSNHVPGFMVFDGRWKLMYGRAANASSLDALYDLKNDPQEMSNLIGKNPDREKYRAETTRIKGLLVDWLTRVKSPSLDSVKARPLFPEPEVGT